MPKTHDYLTEYIKWVSVYLNFIVIAYGSQEANDPLKCDSAVCLGC